MSTTILPEVPTGRVRRRLEMEARCAVLLAHGLTYLPPYVLERVMRLAVTRTKEPALAVVMGYRDAVVSVSSVCAGHGCLPRSIATALVARMHGYGVSWFTGVKDAPFRAHAWVSVANRPVRESPEIESFITVLSAVPSYRRSTTAERERAH